MEQPPSTPLVDIVADTVSQYPDAIALEDEHQRVAYGELEDLIEIHVQRLYGTSVWGAGTAWEFACRPGIDLYVAILATLFRQRGLCAGGLGDPDKRRLYEPCGKKPGSPQSLVSAGPLSDRPGPDRNDIGSPHAGDDTPGSSSPRVHRLTQGSWRSHQPPPPSWMPRR